MKTTVDIKELQNDAEEIFTNGFACSESVIYAIRKHFEINLSDDAIAMSSGFPWGLGGAGCICGALAGGTMCIGYFFGRRTPGDPCVQKCFSLTNELHQKFKDEFSSSCCRVLIKNYPDKDSLERKNHCIEVVRGTVKIVAEILMRELHS